jgi:hypothetical protein
MKDVSGHLGNLPCLIKQCEEKLLMTGASTNSSNILDILVRLYQHTRVLLMNGLAGCLQALGEGIDI